MNGVCMCACIYVCMYVCYVKSMYSSFIGQSMLPCNVSLLYKIMLLHSDCSVISSFFIDSQP